MKTNNILFVIFMSITFTVEVCSMLMPVAKRLYNKKCYAQRRNNETSEKLSNQLQIMTDEEKKQKDKEFCEKIKTVTIIAKRGVDSQEAQQFNVKEYHNKNYHQVDNSRRNENRSSYDFGSLVATMVATKMIYDVNTKHDVADEKSHIINNSDHSSYLYSDSSFCNDSDSSYSDSSSW